MDQVVGALVISYGSTYLIRYTIDYITYSVFKTTCNMVKNSAKQLITPVQKKKRKPIEYQMITEKDDEFIVVNSSRPDDRVEFV